MRVTSARVPDQKNTKSSFFSPSASFFSPLSVISLQTKTQSSNLRPIQLSAEIHECNSAWCSNEEVGAAINYQEINAGASNCTFSKLAPIPHDVPTRCVADVGGVGTEPDHVVAARAGDQRLVRGRGQQRCGPACESGCEAAHLGASRSR
jgi:hypothetical protein